MKLNAYLPTDRHPFDGVREMEPPVRVRMKFLPERYFHASSMLGSSRAAYFEKMRAEGIQLYKTYDAVRLNGFGDVADIVVCNDMGEEKTFPAFLFRDADPFFGE